MKLEREWALAIVSGILCALAFPPVGWSIVLIFAPALLLYAWYLGNRPGWTGFWWAVAFFCTSNFYTLPTFAQRAKQEWVAGVAWVVALLWLSGWYTLIGWLHRRWGWRGFSWASGVASVWVIGCWLRSLGELGFPWGFLSLGWARTPLMLQPADIGGVWLVEWLTLFWNALLVLLLVERHKRYQVALAGVAVAWLGYGGFAFHYWKNANEPSLRVAVAQTGVWSAGSGQNDRYFEALRPFAQEASKQRAEWLVFPETTSPIDLREESGEYPFYANHFAGWQNLSRESGVQIVFGTRYHREGKTFNSALYLSPSGDKQVYDKVRLMPFTEWAPSTRLPFLGALGVRHSSLTPGNRFGRLGDEAPVGTLICVESLHGWIARAQVREGAEWLAVLTNDSWLTHCATREQFADWCVVRAIEARRWLVRASPVGRSGFYAPTGEAFLLPYNTLTTEVRAIAPLNSHTLYVRWGDGWVCGCLAIVGVMSILQFRHHRVY